MGFPEVLSVLEQVVPVKKGSITCQSVGIGIIGGYA
jgi:hypothetical protein